MPQHENHGRRSAGICCRRCSGVLCDAVCRQADQRGQTRGQAVGLSCFTDATSSGATQEFFPAAPAQQHAMMDGSRLLLGRAPAVIS